MSLTCQNSLFSKSCLFASLLHLWNICETCKNIWKQSLFHILHGCAQICSPTASCHWPWNSRVVSLVWPLLASQSSIQWLTVNFYASLGFCQIIHTSHVRFPTCIETLGVVYAGAIFSAVNISQRSCGIPPDCGGLAKNLALLAFRLFPRPLLIHANECCGGVGEGTSICRFKTVPTWWLCGQISTWATR